jgi:hypothetical protein
VVRHITWILDRSQTHIADAGIRLFGAVHPGSRIEGDARKVIRPCRPGPAQREQAGQKGKPKLSQTKTGEAHFNSPSDNLPKSYCRARLGDVKQKKQFFRNSFFK